MVAPDSYGGDLSAPDAARRIAVALRKAGHEVVEHPMADGGEGSLLVLEAHGLVDEVGNTDVMGAYGESVSARIGRLGNDAFVEVAEACGLWRSSRRDARDATSFGVGEMLRDAADATEDGVVVGLGGTATVDAGLGALRALGLVASDERGRPTGDLVRVTRIDGDPPLDGLEVTLLADVHTPFLKAPAVFGPQKGLVDTAGTADAFRRFAEALADWGSRHGYPALDLEVVGGGAAGGLGFALASVLDATLLAGGAWFAERTQLDAAIANADIIVTGEGRLDAASLDGKVVGVVLDHAAGKPTWAIVGSAAPGLLPRVIEIGGTGEGAWLRALNTLAAF
jgi:glycerate kinase